MLLCSCACLLLLPAMYLRLLFAAPLCQRFARPGRAHALARPTLPHTSVAFVQQRLAHVHVPGAHTCCACAQLAQHGMPSFGPVPLSPLFVVITLFHADVKDVKVVVNFDMPKAAEDYVHRIGRTGRAGAKGVAYSFFTAADARLAGQIVSVLQEAHQVVPPELAQFASVSGGAGEKAFQGT